MLANLIKEIRKTTPLDDAEEALCKTYFEELKISKNSIVEEQNKRPQFIYFINAGFMRLFYYDESGNEVTTNLTLPNGFITSFLSFIHQKPAADNVECITDCRLLRISRLNLITLIDKSENFKKFSVTIFENVMASSQIRANDLATLTAELRYKKIINEQPELIQNIPIQYIASFLGIKSQSLSRIRRQLMM